jgi:hypothetical protein
MTKHAASSDARSATRDTGSAGPAAGRRPEGWPEPSPVMRAIVAAAVAGAVLWLLLAWAVHRLWS